MKCYIVSFAGEEWCSLVHGETAGKAKARFHRVNPMGFFQENFTEIRVRRLPGLDDKPISFENAKAAGFQYTDEDGKPMSETSFVNDCDCEICRGENERR